MTLGTLLGRAVGVVGLSLDDFCRLSPGELSAVLQAHGEWSQLESREEWERMRMGACITIQPHVKGKLTPQKLLPLPWEREEKPELPKEKLTMADRRARMAAAMAKVGMK